jgi:hypothetical protein
MPKLYIFALCDRVVTDKEDRASLITLFNQITAQILPASPDIPPNAVAAKEWWTFSSWEIQPEDVGKDYRQIVQLLYPNGEPFGPPVSVSFSPLSGKTRQQVTVTGFAFPIGQEGQYTVKMWLEEGSSTIFESAPIIVTVKHQRLTDLPPNFTPLI